MKNYIYSGEFVGRICDVSEESNIKLIKGYEFSDKRLSQHCTRSIVLSKYKGVKVDNLSIDDIDQIEETEK